jgi:hypothetical protein
MMPSFGSVCILAGGPEFKIRVTGKTYTFEFPHAGPAVLTKTGAIAAVQPTAFLEAASLWNQQGRRMTEDGYCIWTPKPKDILKHLGGRNYEVIGQAGHLGKGGLDWKRPTSFHLRYLQPAWSRLAARQATCRGMQAGRPATV